MPVFSNAGFTSLWLPPVHKAANVAGASMGYDLGLGERLFPTRGLVEQNRPGAPSSMPRRAVTLDML